MPLEPIVVPSLLKQATPSALTRKRKVAQNILHDGRRKKAPKCVSATEHPGTNILDENHV